MKIWYIIVTGDVTPTRMRLSDEYMRQLNRQPLVQITACCLFSVEPLCGWLVDSPHKGPILLSFDVFFVESLKAVEQQSCCWWFETPCSSCNVTVIWYIYATPSCLYCWKLDMSTARDVLSHGSHYPVHSPTPPTMVIQRSRSWSWKVDSHTFRSMSIGPPIPEIRLFETFPLQPQSQGHGCGQRARPYNQPRI